MGSIRALSIAFVILLPSLFSDVLATSWPEAVTVSKPTLRSISSTLKPVTAGQQIIISTTVTHSLGEKNYDIIALIEVRDRYGVTQYLAWQSGIVKVGNRVQIGVSWTPERAGTYELRAFAFTNDWENPQVLSGVKTSVVTIQSPLCTGIAECFVGIVTNIVDGDTLDVEGKRIRLALANTPERGEGGYEEATKFTEGLCPVGSEALVDQDDGQRFDEYERMVAKVFCGSEDDYKILNAELVYDGFAGILTRYCDESEFSVEDWAKQYGCTTTSPSAPVEQQEESNDRNCDPAYPDVCIPPPPPDLDCGEIAYRNFRVLQPDPHRFDSDKDGIGCET